MKKLSYFGGMLLFAAMTYSCASDDKAITEPYTTIQLNGYKYKTDLLATFQGQVGEEVSIGFGVYDNFDICGVDFGDGIIVTDSVGNQNGGIKGTSVVRNIQVLDITNGEETIAEKNWADPYWFDDGGTGATFTITDGGLAITNPKVQNEKNNPIHAD